MDTLLTEILSGKHEDFERLIDQYDSMIRKTVSFLLHKYQRPNVENEVEDIANSIFLLLMESDFKKIRQFKGLSSFATYLRVITTRQVLDVLRKGKKEVLERKDGQIAGTLDDSPSIEKKFEDKQKQFLLENVIGMLDPPEQLLITLVYKKDLPPEEVAGIMNISVSAFYSRKNRILKKIKKMCRKLSDGSSN